MLLQVSVYRGTGCNFVKSMPSAWSSLGVHPVGGGEGVPLIKSIVWGCSLQSDP